MSITKRFLITLSVLIMTACNSTDLQNFMKSAETTGSTKARVQSSAHQDHEFAEAQAQGRLARIKFKEERDQWIGKNSDKLVMKWGNPYQTYQRNDGGKHLVFRKETYSPAYDSWKNETTYYYCVTIFITNAKGVISSWNKEGYCPSDPES